MNHQDDRDDRADSLLGRMLNQNDDAQSPDEDLAPELSETSRRDRVSPVPGRTGPSAPAEPPARPAGPLSPIRPTVPDESPLQTPLMPSLPSAVAPERPLTPREQMQRAEEALIHLREKMSGIAARFADGQLNRAQFEAIYARYSEQRDITERLLARDPDSQAWQSVVRTGHTGFLLEYYAARVLSYSIYDQQTGEQIAVSGHVQVEGHQAQALLERLKAVFAQRGDPGPTQKVLSNGLCVSIVPGTLTAAVVIFSRVPSARQIERVRDLHADFERANTHALRRRDYARSRLVFPHRALFDDHA